ncbi:MAG: hypothetical protein ACRC9Q_01440 [Bacteroidales bacterium]
MNPPYRNFAVVFRLYNDTKFSQIDALSKRNHPNLAQTFIPIMLLHYFWILFFLINSKLFPYNQIYISKM